MILVVGEFLSNIDAEKGGPFMDGLGLTFKSLMRQAGIEPRECKFINVINRQSPTNSMFGFCGTKDDGIPRVRYLKRGKYVLAKYQPDLEHLWDTINALKPTLVLAVGDMPLWALTSESAIKTARGRITPGNSAIPGIKVLPCYSPRQLMAEWALRPIILADLGKAQRESTFPDIRRPQRFIHLHPTIEDLEDFLTTYILPCDTLDVDIENKQEIITCVGFAPTPDRAIVVPFFSQAHEDGNYWRTEREEYIAWKWVMRVLRLGKRVGGQNYQYDMQHLWRTMGIKNPNFTDDTMLMHHALQPEMLKGLGFLGSVYTDELSWKFMHKVASTDKTAKKGDGE
jgi:uracil-DNA glycosylase